MLTKEWWLFCVHIGGGAYLLPWKWRVHLRWLGVHQWNLLLCLCRVFFILHSSLLFLPCPLSFSFLILLFFHRVLHFSNFALLFSTGSNDDWTTLRIISLSLLAGVWVFIIIFFSFVSFSNSFRKFFHLESLVENKSRFASSISFYLSVELTLWLLGVCLEFWDEMDDRNIQKLSLFQ